MADLVNEEVIANTGRDPTIEKDSNNKLSLPCLFQQPNKWSLEPQLATFYNQVSSKRLDKSQMESYLEIPSPENIKAKSKLDQHYKALLEGKNFHRTLKQDEGLANTQAMFQSAMGPLAYAWQITHGLYQGLLPTDEEGESMDEDRKMEVQQAKELMDSMNAGVVLFGQAMNRLVYERRVQVLGDLNTPQLAKAKLKAAEASFAEEESDELFGKTFREDVKEQNKTIESLDLAPKQ